MSRRKPRHLKLLEGNPGGRPILDESPKPQPIRPRCPSHLSKRAKREWRRVAPQLEKLCLLTKLDATALACYCSCYARWRQAAEILNEKGSMYEPERGVVKPRPEVKIALDARRLATAFARDFGMTPLSRGKMNLPPRKPDDEWD